jgi:RNA polymerase sigma-70 factor (ECF subfamily)
MNAIWWTDREDGGSIPGNKTAQARVLRRRMAPRVFEETVLPHLDAAFNYARWLTKNDAEAEDVVQDACVRAMRFFSSLRNEDARGWLFAIVRNTWYSRVSRRPTLRQAKPVAGAQDEPPDAALDPEEQLLQQQTVTRVRAALEELPVDFREVIVLREIEGLSYKEIAAVVRVPIGTVMSRLARARERLLAVLRSSTPMELLP